MNIPWPISKNPIPETRMRCHHMKSMRQSHRVSAFGTKKFSKGLSRHMVLRLVYALALTFFLLFGGCTTKREDQSSIPPPHIPVRDFPDTPIGNMVNNHMGLLVAVGEDAEEKYQTSLQLLRKKIPEVVKIIYHAYVLIDTTRYFRRWALVETLRELHSDSTVPFLIEIASSPIPEERWSDPEASSGDKESNIRVTAVEGIAEMAKRGNQNAEQALIKFFSHDDLSVRRQAIRGYLKVGRDYKERAAYLQQILPEKDHWLINLDVTDPKEVPHPDIPDKLTTSEVKKRESTPIIKEQEN